MLDLLRKELERQAKKYRLGLPVIEQDYLITWILSCLYEHPILKEHLIFKGGTALKKCYFGEYRFSEDLDFTVIADLPGNQKFFSLVKEVCETAEQKIRNFSDIRLEVKVHKEKEPHPFNQEAFEIKATFPWHGDTPYASTKIELTTQETLVYPDVRKPLLHSYERLMSQEIRAYSLEEIVLEKLRAILQRTKKLHEENQDRPRPRDYYDLWRILENFQNELFFNDFAKMLRLKCDPKKVQFQNAESFFDPEVLDSASRGWKSFLGPLVSDLPDFELVINDLKDQIELLFSNQNEMAQLVRAMAQKKLRGEMLYRTLLKAIHHSGDVNQKLPNGHPFLHLLIKSNMDSRQKLELVKLAALRGANLNHVDPNRLTPLGTAVAEGEAAIAKFLKDKKASEQIPANLYAKFYSIFLGSPR